MLRRWGVIQHKLVLTTGLIKWIGHRREDSKADVSASVCTSSEQIASERIDSLRQRANARNVPFRISLRWPIHFWTQLKTPIYLCTNTIEELNLGLPRETSSFSGQIGSWTRNLRTSGLDLAIAQPYMITKLTRNKTQLNTKKIQPISIATNLCTDMWYSKDPLQQMYDLQLWFRIPWPPTVL